MWHSARPGLTGLGDRLAWGLLALGRGHAGPVHLSTQGPASTGLPKPLNNCASLAVVMEVYGVDTCNFSAFLSGRDHPLPPFILSSSRSDSEAKPRLLC